MDPDVSQAARARARSVRAPPAHRAIAGRWGLLMLIGGWGGVVVARVPADRYQDPSSSAALLVAFGVLAVSLVAIAAGCRIVIGAARSPLRYVFRSRPALSAAAMLIFAGAAVVTSSMLGDPFGRFAAHGDFTARTATELGGIVAALVCLGSGVTAALDAWDARRDERTWGRRASSH